jgi:hypothetical protein
VLLGGLPVYEPSLALFDQAPAFIQHIFVPLRYRHILLSPAKVIPERFHSTQFFIQRHLVDLKLSRHKPNLLGFGRAAILFEIKSGKGKRDDGTTGSFETLKS